MSWSPASRHSRRSEHRRGRGRHDYLWTNMRAWMLPLLGRKIPVVGRRVRLALGDDGRLDLIGLVDQLRFGFGHGRLIVELFLAVLALNVGPCGWGSVAYLGQVGGSQWSVTEGRGRTRTK